MPNETWRGARDLDIILEKKLGIHNVEKLYVGTIFAPTDVEREDLLLHAKLLEGDEGVCRRGRSERKQEYDVRAMT
jgi:hypothetical protein